MKNQVLNSLLCIKNNVKQWPASHYYILLKGFAKLKCLINILFKA